MFERFTDRSRIVMALANQEALRFLHEHIGTEHILLGLIKEGSGVGANVLKNLDLDLHKVRLEVEKLVKIGTATVMGQLPRTPRANKAIKFAIEEACNLNHNSVGTEHLLLGLCRERDGIACTVLSNFKVSVEDVREEVTFLLGAEKVPVELMEPDLLSQLQKIINQEVMTPFSFRFIEDEARYELLDSSGKVLDEKAFDGPVGAYIFNALRKHEKSQQLLRNASKQLEVIASNEAKRLIGRIGRFLDS